MYKADIGHSWAVHGAGPERHGLHEAVQREGPPILLVAGEAVDDYTIVVADGTLHGNSSHQLAEMRSHLRLWHRLPHLRAALFCNGEEGMAPVGQVSSASMLVLCLLTGPNLMFSLDAPVYFQGGQGSRFQTGAVRG